MSFRVKENPKLHQCSNCPVLAASQDSENPEDEGRRFVLSYFLSNDMISIFEIPTRNSGIIGGKFLEKTRVPKPGSTVDKPEFYSPADFAIGATVDGNLRPRAWTIRAVVLSRLLLANLSSLLFSFRTPFCVD